MSNLKLPPDPDRQNDDRAEWARVAVRAFIGETQTDKDDAVADLLADLMHLCDRDGYYFERELERAQRMYGEETKAEAA